MVLKPSSQPVILLLIFGEDVAFSLPLQIVSVLSSFQPVLCSLQTLYLGSNLAEAVTASIIRSKNQAKHNNPRKPPSASHKNGSFLNGQPSTSVAEMKETNEKRQPTRKPRGKYGNNTLKACLIVHRMTLSVCVNNSLLPHKRKKVWLCSVCWPFYISWMSGMFFLFFLKMESVVKLFLNPGWKCSFYVQPLPPVTYWWPIWYPTQALEESKRLTMSEKQSSS